MKSELFTVRNTGTIYFNSILAKRIGFSYGDSLEFRITGKNVYFRINNNSPLSCRVYASSTSGYLIKDKNIYARISEIFIYDVRIVRVRNWFKLVGMWDNFKKRSLNIYSRRIFSGFFYLGFLIKTTNLNILYNEPIFWNVKISKKVVNFCQPLSTCFL